MKRRTFITGTGALCLTGAGFRPANAADDTQQAYISCGADRSGNFLAAAFDGTGRIVFSIPLPERGHDIVVHPGGNTAIIVARRPGTWFSVLDLRDGRQVRRIATRADRHLYGHGAFSPDGTRFYTTENDFDSGIGAIGVYDARNDYRRIGEFPSCGVGPHQLSISPDGNTLTVANGGIRTHPDTGRSKLNTRSMKPNVAFLDTRSGKATGSVDLSETHHKLSIRHFDTNADGMQVFGMQFEGDKRRPVPLVALLTTDRAFRFLTAPPETLRRMQQYVGSVRFDRSGRYVATSCPRGNMVVIWNAETGAFLRAVTAPDASGLAATSRTGEFLVTSGTGSLSVIGPAREEPRVVKREDAGLHWDNHTRAIGPLRNI